VPEVEQLTPAQRAEKVQRYVDRQVQLGLHGPFKTVCDGCRRWVSSIWHVDPATKRRLCPCCAKAAGMNVSAELLASPR
jgi:hypothetical protein